MWSGWVQGNSNGPLVPMVRLVPIEKHPIPMVLLVNMHPLRGVKMLLPIEIDESFLKVVHMQLADPLLLFHSLCLLLEIECLILLIEVFSFRKAYVNYREIVTYR